MKITITANINLDDYQYIGNQHGYQLYRKIVNGKGQWVAQDQDSLEPPFPITYQQALGYEPIIRSDIEKLRYDLGKKLLGSADAGYQYTATQIVRDLYDQFPRVEFIDETDLGDMVRLKFNVPRNFEQHAELEDYLNNCGCKYTLLNTMLRIDAPEEEEYII